MKTVIVIPTYNEKENLTALVPAIFELSVPDLEVVIIDDNSPDQTAKVAEQLSNSYPLHLVKRRGKLGIGSAYIAGFKKALALQAEYITTMDADWSHNPKDIPRMLEALNEADLVIGSRKITHGQIIGWSWQRKFMSDGAMWFARTVLQLKTHDVTAGFRAYRRKVINAIDLDKIKSNGYAFQEEIVWRTEKLNFKIKEMPVVFTDRSQGKSKLSKKDIVEFFVVMLKLRFATVKSLW